MSYCKKRDRGEKRELGIHCLYMHIISQKLGTIYHVAITLFCSHIFWPTTDRVLSIVCSTSPSSALQYSWYESQDSTGRLQLLEIKDIQLLPDKSVWYEVLPFAIVFKLIMNQGSVALVAVWLFHSSLASFPGLQRLQFLIACSVQKRSQKAWWILPCDSQHGWRHRN